MRYGRSAKQRVWLGPGRHRGRCGYTITNPHAEPYTNTNSYACCMRAVGNANAYSHCDSDGYCYANSDCNSYSHPHGHANTYSHSHGDTDCHSYSDRATESDTYSDCNSEGYANTEAASNPAASSVIR